MRIVCISDTHTKHNDVTLPEGDVLVHTGDGQLAGRIEELKNWAHWMKEQAKIFKHALFIGGNHDFSLEAFLKDKSEYAVRDMFAPCHYLRDESASIEGIKFYGSPWQPEFCNWAFNLERGPELKAKWDMIDKDTDVLLTHTPPAGILDQVKPFDRYTRTRAGCDDLQDKVKVVQPRLHVFGHIHSGYGAHSDGDTMYVNASVVNERYNVVNRPITYDIN